MWHRCEEFFVSPLLLFSITFILNTIIQVKVIDVEKYNVENRAERQHIARETTQQNPQIILQKSETAMTYYKHRLIALLFILTFVSCLG